MFLSKISPKQHFFFLNVYQLLSVFSSANTFQQAFLLQFCYNEFYSILWGRLFYYHSHGYKSYSYRRCRQVRAMLPNAHKQPIK